MVRFCIVPNCNNNDLTALCHRFPKNQKLKDEWIKNLNLTDNPHADFDKYVVCTLHFNISDYRHVNSNCLNSTACPKLKGITPRPGVMYNNSSRKRPKINSVVHIHKVHVSKISDGKPSKIGNFSVFNDNVDPDGNNSKECHYFLYEDDLSKIGKKKRKLIKEIYDKDDGNIALVNINKDIEVNNDNDHNEFENFDINYKDEDRLSININLLNGKAENTNNDDADTSTRYSLVQDDGNEEIILVPKQMKKEEEDYQESNDNSSNNYNDYDNKKDASYENVLNFIGKHFNNDSRIRVSVEQQKQEDLDVNIKDGEEVKEDEKEAKIIESKKDGQKNRYHENILIATESDSDENEEDSGDTLNHRRSTFSVSNVKQFNVIEKENDEDEYENDNDNYQDDNDEDKDKNDDDDGDTLDDEYSDLTKSQLIKLLKQSKQKITDLECKVHKMKNAHKQLMNSLKNFQSLL